MKEKYLMRDLTNAQDQTCTAYVRYRFMQQNLGKFNDDATSNYRLLDASTGPHQLGFKVETIPKDKVVHIGRIHNSIFQLNWVWSFCFLICYL